MPALLRQMGFLRWLSGKGGTQLRFDTDGAGGDRGEAGRVAHVHSRAFSNSVQFLGVVGAARLERGEPAAEAGELIRR